MRNSLFDSSESILLAASQGAIPGYSTIHKFGHNAAVSTTIVPICEGGNYRMPTGTATLAVISDSANDTAAGSGAREVTLEYLDSTGAEQTGTIATNGVTESTGTVSGVWRLNRVYVSLSGSYANQATASHSGNLTIREASAGQTWATMPVLGTGFGSGQSLIGAYTVPLGKTAYILSIIASVDSNKSATIYFMARNNALDTTAPYPALQLKNIYAGITGGPLEVQHLTNEAYNELTDLIFMAKASQASDVSIEIEMLIKDNN